MGLPPPAPYPAPGGRPLPALPPPPATAGPVPACLGLAPEALQKHLCCLHVCPWLQMTPGPGLGDSQQPVPASQARATWLSPRQGEQTAGQPSQSARGWCSDRGAFGGCVVREPGAIKVGSAMPSSQAANLILPLRVPTRNGRGDKEGKGGRSLEGRRRGEGHVLSQALSWALLAVGLT